MLPFLKVALSLEPQGFEGYFKIHVTFVTFFRNLNPKLVFFRPPCHRFSWVRLTCIKAASICVILHQANAYS
jgi:hypothetical protein